MHPAIIRAYVTPTNEAQFIWFLLRCNIRKFWKFCFRHLFKPRDIILRRDIYLAVIGDEAFRHAGLHRPHTQAMLRRDNFFEG